MNRDLSAGSARRKIRRGVTFVSPLRRKLAVGVALAAMLAGTNLFASGNIVLTGHDDDYHWTNESSSVALSALKAMIVFARNGSSLKVLAFDHGTELTTALAAAGIPYDAVDPDKGTPPASLFNHAVYSAIVIASDSTCGGCDNTTTSSSNLANAASGFASFVNGGGGIVGLAGANNFNYYKFLPASVTNPGIVDCSTPGATCGFTQTAQGAKVGIPADNIDYPHNYFPFPGTGGMDPAWLVAETYSGPAFNASESSITLTNQPFTVFIPNAAVGGNGFLTITTTSLPSGTVGIAYNAPLTAGGGNTPYTWSATGLPPGLQVAGSSITGIPTQAGTFSVTLTVNDSSNPPLSTTTEVPLTLLINQPLLTVTTASLPSGTVGVAYNAPLAAIGGITPYRWFASGLPPGLQVSGSSITGTPTAPGTFVVGLTVQDSSIPFLFANTTVPINLVINPGTLSITTASLPSGTTNVAYSATVAATGGKTPYTWSATGLPPGLSINSTTGTISGTPTTANSYNVAVTVKDSNSPQGNVTTSFQLVISAGLTITTASLPNGIIGVAYSTPLAATGGTLPYNWSANGLPPGLSVNAATGTISGTPTTTGSYSVSVTVTDNLKANATKSFTIGVSAGLTITTASLPSGSIGGTYNTTVSASGGTPGYSWSATGLPAGLSINAASGTISGTPTAAGSSNVAITVKDSSSPQLNASKTLTLVINGQLQMSCSTSNGPTFVGTSYTGTCTALGGTPGYTFSISGGSLPGGIAAAASGASYTISGKPAASGSFSYTVQVKDSGGAAQTQPFSGTIGPQPIVNSFTLAAVPSISNQYTASLTLGSSAPTALTGTLCLTFKADASVPGAASYQTQEVQFASGVTSASCGPTPKNTLSFTVPAGSSTAAWAGNNSQFSQGTVAGTVTVTVMSLSDVNGNSVLSGSGASQTVAVAVGQPSVTNTVGFTTTSSTITVTFDAVTSKRSISGVNYVFNSSGSPVTVPVSFTSGSFSGMDQSQWFATAASVPTGGAFSLTATFPCTNCSSITGVQVTVTN